MKKILDKLPREKSEFAVEKSEKQDLDKDLEHYLCMIQGNGRICSKMCSVRFLGIIYPLFPNKSHPVMFR